MNDASEEFNKQLELDVLVSGMTEITRDYVAGFDRAKLVDIVIPMGVKCISWMAFEYCTCLTSITIPDTVTSIGIYAFDSCYNLKNITIPDSVMSIGPGAFSWCKRLKDVTIGSGVKSIREEAFEHCLYLKTVTFKGKTLDEVRSMEDYPWAISPEKICVQVF